MVTEGIIIPDWIWYAFIFAFGCCVGSFLNVVIYRLPRDKSIVRPPSSCPSCGQPIRFYDNIPLISWVALLGKCRFCKVWISPRYFIVELITGLSFVGVFYLYFRSALWAGMPAFIEGGWLIFVMSLVLVGGFLAASAIDLELWIIPITICWFITAVGLIGTGLSEFVISEDILRGYNLLSFVSSDVAAMSAGGLIGLAAAWGLLVSGLIKRSYDFDENNEPPNLNHRREVLKEIVFLAPIILFAFLWRMIVQKVPAINDWWVDFSNYPFIGGFLGAIWGYLIGCGVVWATRIFGTLAFGREAMGLGDVHLMGAAGAIIGAVPVTVAFFIAPFFGLGWALIQLFFRKIRQIPYGPFLSLGVFTVMILHDRIYNYMYTLFFH